MKTFIKTERNEFIRINDITAITPARSLNMATGKMEEDGTVLSLRNEGVITMRGIPAAFVAEMLIQGETIDAKKEWELFKRDSEGV